MVRRFGFMVEIYGQTSVAGTTRPESERQHDGPVGRSGGMAIVR
jgi:hypothetical protein